MLPLYSPEYTFCPCTAIEYTACDSPSSDAVLMMLPAFAEPRSEVGLPASGGGASAGAAPLTSAGVVEEPPSLEARALPPSAAAGSASRPEVDGLWKMDTAMLNAWKQDSGCMYRTAQLPSGFLCAWKTHCC